MVILSQDRDLLICCIKEELHVFTVINNDKLTGFNLMQEDIILGTFDTYDEAEQEMMNVKNYDKSCYMVSGYDEDMSYSHLEEIKECMIKLVLCSI